MQGYKDEEEASGPVSCGTCMSRFVKRMVMDFCCINVMGFVAEDEPNPGFRRIRINTSDHNSASSRNLLLSGILQVQPNEPGWRDECYTVHD